MQPDISIVIPCYNEEEVLRNTMNRLWEAFQNKPLAVEFVLVDNGSQDRTGAIIDELVAEGQIPVVKAVVTVNQGYGYGILSGLGACRGRWVGFTCADGQVEAHDVYRVSEIAVSSKGPRMVKVRRRFRMDGWIRKVVSILYNLFGMVLFNGLGTLDINGNPKVLPRQVLEDMQLESHDWFLDAEILIKAKQMKLPVLEMNVLAFMREGGSSNVRSSTCWEFFGNMLSYRFGLKGAIRPARTSANS